MYICICNGITDHEIRRCAQSGKCSMRELEGELGVGVGCGRCREAAGEILEELHPSAKALQFSAQAA